MRGNPFVRAFLTAKALIVLMSVLYLLFRFVAVPNSTMALVLYKLVLGIAAAVVGHIVVKALYPYVSISRMLMDDKKNEGPDATKFVGVCILRGAVMAAFILGVLLGV